MTRSSLHRCPLRHGISHLPEVEGEKPAKQKFHSCPIGYFHLEHRLTKPSHPWTDGQVERMNRTIKDPAVKRYHYDDHAQMCAHLSDFVMAYNFAKRLKTLKGLTPYNYICKIWTVEPERFKLDPIHQMPGLNS